MNDTQRKLISDKFRNTSLGFFRIKRNLDILYLTDSETEIFLRKIILSTDLSDIETKSKNHYFKCFKYNAILTVNLHTLTIITAKHIE